MKYKCTLFLPCYLKAQNLFQETSYELPSAFVITVSSERFRSGLPLPEPKGCRILAFYTFWAIILAMFGGLGMV